jgi:hypothetical protein
MINKKIYLSIGILLMGILLIGNVLAFAVSSMYWEENPLTIKPGETQKSFIVLQNMAGSETINARVTVLEGSDIVTLDNPNMIYEIPVGQTVNVYYTVIIPLTSVTGQATSPITGGIYNLIFDVTTVTPQGAGTFSFGSGMQKVVPVLITIPIIEKEVAPWLYYLIVGLLVVIIIVVVVLIIRKKKRK